jgi:hypothetical protein
MLDLFADASTVSGGDFLVCRSQDANPILLVKGNGNIGVNTATPTSVFDVQVNTLAGINFTNQGQSPLLDFRANNVESAGRIRVGENGGGAEMLFHTKTTGGTLTEAFRVDTVQRVLVGTTADRAIEMPFGNALNSAQPGKLVIEDSGAGHLNMIVARENQSNAYGPAISLVKSRGTSDGSYTVVQSGDNLGTIQFGGADGSVDRVGAAIVSQVDNTPGSDDMPGRLMFATTADGSGHPTERLRITSTGAVLIGTTTPTGNTDRLLQVGDTSRSSSYIEVRTSTSGASGVVFSDGVDGSNTGYRGTIEYAHSADRLDFKTAGVTRLQCDSSGNFTATGNVTAYSDVTLKENIETIPNALDKVLNLRGVEFDRNDKENNPHEIGVIAQEVEEVVPEVVLTNEEGLKSVAYGNLVGLLIESIKELKAEVNDLKAQLEG